MPGSGIQIVPDGVTPTDPYTLQNNLASTAPGQGASTIGVTPNGCFTSTNVQDALEEICAGAATGDCVTLGVDPAAVLANSCYTAWVSAADTVTVRFNNYSTGALNPAAGTFKIIVTK